GIATDNIKLNFIEKNLGKINIWNQSHVIFMDRIEYDSKGVWIFFKIDPDRLNAQLDDWIDELVDWVHGFTW
ncbi:MAG: hypothetical protein Q8Q54_01335, partial [Methylococcales bacterium]|nr:hypothetical protein [Methylococcales bacterium]